MEHSSSEAGNLGDARDKRMRNRAVIKFKAIELGRIEAETVRNCLCNQCASRNTVGTL